MKRNVRLRVAVLIAASVMAAPMFVPSQAWAATSGDLAAIQAARTPVNLTSAVRTTGCASVVGGSQAPGTAVVLYNCHQGSNQLFQWSSDGTLRSSAGNVCLDTQGSQSANNTAVVINPCTGGATQQWRGTTAGQVIGVNERCLTLRDAVSANMTPLILYGCVGGANQRWIADTLSAPLPNPSPPVAPPAPIPSGITISPGQSIQAAVSANPPGTTFVIKAGTHVRQSVIPKSGDVFVGEPGAVLDGQNVAPYAFTRGPLPYPSYVTIKNLKITNYASPQLTAAVDAGGAWASEGSIGWVIQNNEISYNSEYGIRIGNGVQILGNNVHHNKRLNIGGSSDDVVIADNEIAYGNWGNFFNTNFEAGGTKFAQTHRMTLRNNYVHDNLGVGLHMDENNIDTTIESNRIDHNGSEGIAIEISYSATIRNNTVTNNGWNDPRNRYTYLWNAGIGVHASPNVEIYGNTVSGNYAGIIAIQQDRSVDAPMYGPHVVSNLYVHDNTVTQTNIPSAPALSVAAGIAQDNGNLSVFTSNNNRWVNNHYVLGSNPYPFAWQNGVRTAAQWRAYGQDTGSSFA